jgi:4-hydroxybenzoyl-CoA thioesterase
MIRTGLLRNPTSPFQGEVTQEPRIEQAATEHKHMPYLTNTVARRIQWGECDPAGIVFYPRYFEMFDGATTAMFSAATGLTNYQMFEHYKFAGYPMVDTRARFLIPCRFGDDIVIETTMTEAKRSSFNITHHLKKDGALAVEAFETRVWVGRDPADANKIKSQPIPAEVLAKLSRS